MSASSRKLRIVKAGGGDKVLLSGNYQANLTTLLLDAKEENKYYYLCNAIYGANNLSNII